MAQRPKGAACAGSFRGSRLGALARLAGVELDRSNALGFVVCGDAWPGLPAVECRRHASVCRLAVILLRVIGTRPGNPGRIGRAVAGTGSFIALLGGAFIAYILVLLSSDAQANWTSWPVNSIAISNLVIPCIAGLIAMVLGSVNAPSEKPGRASHRWAMRIGAVAPIGMLAIALVATSLVCESALWFVPR